MNEAEKQVMEAYNQGINIPAELKNVQKEFENPVYIIMKKAFSKLM